MAAEDDVAGASGAGRRDPERAAVKAALIGASSLTVLAGAIIAPSLPAMQAHYAQVPNAAFWVKLVLTLPALFIVLGAPFVGWLADRYGRKRLLLGAMVLYALAGCSGFVFAGSLNAVLAGRALLGIAVAGIMTCVTALIADYYAGPARAKLLGVQAAAMGLGGTVYTGIGGLVAGVDWRFPFLIYGAALLFLPFTARVLFEPTMEAGPAPDRSGPEVPAEGLPLRLMASVYAVMFLAQATFYLLPTQLPFHLKDLIGADAKTSGAALAAGTFAYASGSLIGPWWGRVLATRRRLLVALAFGVVGTGYALIGHATTLAGVIGAMVVGGIGFGFVIPNLGAWLMARVPAPLRGRALGGLTASLFLGHFLSPILAQPAVAAAGGVGPVYSGVGYALLAGSALLAVGSTLAASAAARRRDEAATAPLLPGEAK